MYFGGSILGNALFCFWKTAAPFWGRRNPAFYFQAPSARALCRPRRKPCLQCPFINPYSYRRTKTKAPGGGFFCGRAAKRPQTARERPGVGGTGGSAQRGVEGAQGRAQARLRPGPRQWDGGRGRRQGPPPTAERASATAGAGSGSRPAEKEKATLRKALHSAAGLPFLRQGGGDKTPPAACGRRGT